MKKIISFAVWGANEHYCRGAIINAERAKKFYPGWICRFYCDALVPKTIIDELVANYDCEVVKREECKENIGLYWRFEPMFDDPDIERFIVRDIDSWVNAREADAVQEWVESDLPFHIMRDHVQHQTEIMGGMWGSKARIIPEFETLMMYWFVQLEQNADLNNPRGKYHGTDQIFLQRYIWPLIEKCHMAHDEIYHYSKRERPFRIKLKRDGYIGMVVAPGDEDRTEAEEIITTPLDTSAEVVK